MLQVRNSLLLIRQERLSLAVVSFELLPAFFKQSTNFVEMAEFEALNGLFALVMLANDLHVFLYPVCDLRGD